MRRSRHRTQYHCTPNPGIRRHRQQTLGLVLLNIPPLSRIIQTAPRRRNGAPQVSSVCGRQLRARPHGKIRGTGRALALIDTRTIIHKVFPHVEGRPGSTRGNIIWHTHPVSLTHRAGHRRDVPRQRAGQRIVHSPFQDHRISHWPSHRRICIRVTVRGLCHMSVQKGRPASRRHRRDRSNPRLVCLGPEHPHHENRARPPSPLCARRGRNRGVAMDPRPQNMERAAHPHQIYRQRQYRHCTGSPSRVRRRRVCRAKSARVRQAIEERPLKNAAQRHKN